MINILEAQRAGLFGQGKIVSNVIAGVIVGVVALPLAMAFAIASGARPEQGLYTAIVAGFLVSTLGGSRTQIAGPTGAFIAILAAITAQYGIDGLQIASFMAGLILLLMGWAKLGGVIKFIPAPVLIGFTAGIGVIIWVGQWGYFFGLPPVISSHFHEKLWESFLTLPQWHATTTAISMGSLVIVIFSVRVPILKRIPGPLIALLMATALQAVFHFDGVATIGTAFGGIPQKLPTFAIPDVSISRMIELIGPAFTIAMLGAIESLLSAEVADNMARTHHDSNQELVGQGLANMATPFFGGFAATGAIARTATNIRNGGTSPLAGITHAATLLLIILLLAPLAANVPLGALAAILFVVAFTMSEIPRVVSIVLRAPRTDVAILVITFLLTVFSDLVIAVTIGVLLAMVQFLRGMISSVRVLQLTANEIRSELNTENADEEALPEGVLVHVFEGPLFFGTVENFEHALTKSDTDPDVVVLRLLCVPIIDMTAILMLEEVITSLKKRGVRVILCDANAGVIKDLTKAGVVDLIGKENCTQTMALALSRCHPLPIYEPHTRTFQDIEKRHDHSYRLSTRLFIRTSRQYFWGEKEQ